MSFSVLGAGELGLACGLALRANGASRVTLVNRDGLLRRAQEALLVGAAKNPSTSTANSTLLPGGVDLVPVRRLPDSNPSAIRSVFLCTPVTALLPQFTGLRNRIPAPPQRSDGERAECGDTTALPPLVDLISRCNVDGEGSQSFVACLGRGLGPDGETASHMARAALDCGTHSRTTALPIYTVCGPIIPKEWLHQSLGRLAKEASLRGAGGGSPAPPGLGFSGTALTFALSGVAAPRGGLGDEGEYAKLARDDGFHAAMEQLFSEGLFGRESVCYERDLTSGAALDIVNGCLPLCAFGAGLVSNAYSGASVSALAAYAQHCATATTALVNDLVEGRAKGTPLPMGANAALFSACNVFSSKEFILGRHLDFKFRQMDALKAVYPGRSYEIFSATVDGLHTLMKERQVASPFFEVLMDAFGTVIRASTAGQGLVKQGCYDYRESATSPLLEHAMRIDEAMLSGDEERFEEAKRQLEEVFSYYPTKRK